MVSFDPNIKNNPFTKVNSTGFGGTQYAPTFTESEPTGAGYEQYGTGQGPNGLTSNGVHGSVEGTDVDGKHKLNMYM